MKIDIPYGKTGMVFECADERISAIIAQDISAREAMDETAVVADALAHPIGSPRLAALARGKRRVTVITSDHTRPMPSSLTLPPLLAEIRRGAKNAEITILVATGLHRATTKDELRLRFGSELCEKEKIIVHDCFDAAHLRSVGVLPSGGPLALSTYAIDADLLVSEGLIEPHFFAGFSGGRKSVLPGVAGYASVVANHCSAFIADERASAGILAGNPIHNDMAYAAAQARLSFILNVILDERQSIAEAVAGDAVLAHAEGCARLRRRVSTKAQKADIIITSNGGYPLDQNLYQMVKCMATAEKCCAEGGVIIAVGACCDGVGGDDFYRDFAEHAPEELLAMFVARNSRETKKDQWQSQILARILTNRNVILVSENLRDEATAMGLRWAPDLAASVNLADRIIGRKDASVIVVPNGVSVLMEEEIAR
ncbi:MAG: nickel-dependent lactate racemase [Clostridiales Family XIII bacterium]|jgi:nickel-dependent lactate racemase|nr:nickel-dependent lactate racemase [Clostridiales Family XIII bacterium]